MHAGWALMCTCGCLRCVVLLVCSGRKLTWQTNMGTADIRAQFPSNKRYDLQVSRQAACSRQPC